MPKDFRKFKREIERYGLKVVSTSKQHYRVETEDGRLLVMFAVSHGARTKGGEVWNNYVNAVDKEIQKYIAERKSGEE